VAICQLPTKTIRVKFVENPAVTKYLLLFIYFFPRYVKLAGFSVWTLQTALLYKYIFEIKWFDAKLSFICFYVYSIFMSKQTTKKMLLAIKHHNTRSNIISNTILHFVIYFSRGKEHVNETLEVIKGGHRRVFYF
jgi:hypothetical protein